MRVCVTGGTGFIGSHLVETLLARGDDVTCLVRSPDKLANLFPDHSPHLVHGDLDDTAALRAAVRDVEVVFHAAGATAARSRHGFFAVNAEGTAHLVRAVQEAAPGVRRVVQVSTLSAAGPAAPGKPLDETVPPRPVSWYGESKLAGEETLRASGLPWTVVRPPTVFGPREVELFRVFAMARRGIVPLAGNPHQELSLVYVHDLIAALLAVLAPAAERRTYFAAHPAIVTARELTLAIAAAIRDAYGDGRPRRVRMPRVPGWLARAVLTSIGTGAALLGRATLLSRDKAKEFLAPAWTCTAAALEQDTAWRAQTAHPMALRTTAAWYREHGWL